LSLSERSVDPDKRGRINWAKRGDSKVFNELLKIENAKVLKCMKAFAGTFGSPAIIALGAFDPWLCVTAFRQICPFAGKIIKFYDFIIVHFEADVKYYSDWH